MGNYDDIINLPHHVSKRHPQMSMWSRAAQFAPFSALTGYGDAIKASERENEKNYEQPNDDQDYFDQQSYDGDGYEQSGYDYEQSGYDGDDY